MKPLNYSRLRSTNWLRKLVGRSLLSCIRFRLTLSFHELFLKIFERERKTLVIWRREFMFMQTPEQNIKHNKILRNKTILSNNIVLNKLFGENYWKHFRFQFACVSKLQVKFYLFSYNTWINSNSQKSSGFSIIARLSREWSRQTGITIKLSF